MRTPLLKGRDPRPSPTAPACSCRNTVDYVGNTVDYVGAETAGDISGPTANVELSISCRNSWTHNNNSYSASVLANVGLW